MPKHVHRGISFHYEDTGSGAPPLLLIHGLFPGASFFAPTIERYRARHRIVLVDLPGFGASAAPPPGTDLPAIAGLLAGLIPELGLHRPVAIGHSMGGVLAAELAGRPGLLAGAVILDAPLCPLEAARGAFAGFGAALATAGWLEAVRGFAGSVLAPSDPQALRARVHEEAAALRPEVLGSIWESFLRLDTEALVRRLAVPALHVHAVMPVDLTRLRQLSERLALGATIGSGHFPHLVVPQQVHAMIDSFLPSAAAP